jgi:hypothetical protein
MAARSCFVCRRSGVSGGHFLVRLSGPFPGADLLRERALRGGAVKDGRAMGGATAERRAASCVRWAQRSGGESPLCNLMEVKHE